MLELLSLETECWELIEKGCLSYKHEFHLMMVASASNNIPHQRTVVLKHVWPEKKAIGFHTDIRSNKAHQIKNNQFISALFYAPSITTQIRFFGIATICEEGDLFENAWTNTRLESRKVYLSQPGSGGMIPTPSDGIPGFFTDRNPTEEESAVGKKNFCVVKINIHTMEWVKLHHKGPLD